MKNAAILTWSNTPTVDHLSHDLSPQTANGRRCPQPEPQLDETIDQLIEALESMQRACASILLELSEFQSELELVQQLQLKNRTLAQPNQGSDRGK